MFDFTSCDKNVAFVSRNLRTAFRPMGYLKSEGIYLVDPLADKTNLKKSQPVKLLSVDGIRKALRFVIINMGTVPAGLYCKDILLFFYST